MKQREWMGVEPTAACRTARHRFWRSGDPPGPNHPQAKHNRGGCLCKV